MRALALSGAVKPLNLSRHAAFGANARVARHINKRSAGEAGELL